jgi:NAD(P)-dependent dehydrogenase (short-subunit alcohol dehydrogenase family)
MFSLNKKTAVITGAAGGIGFAIAQRFRAAGAAKGGLEPNLTDAAACMNVCCTKRAAIGVRHAPCT